MISVVKLRHGVKEIMSTNEKDFLLGVGGDGEEEQGRKPSRVERSEAADRAKVKLVMSRLISTVLKHS